MKPKKHHSRIRNLPAIFVLLAALTLSACAPAVTMPVETTVITQGPPSVSEATATLEAGTSAPVPAATSRGPDLEATDPSTVSLASGQLQLVEFFRFT